MAEPDSLGEIMMRLVAARGFGGSVCPSDVARAVVAEHAASGDAPDAWRGQLTAVRRTAIRLAEAGQIEILRKGKPVPPAGVRGVIRLRLAAPAIGVGDTQPAAVATP